MNNYSDQQLPINFNNNFNQFQNDESSLHSPHNTSSSASSSFNVTPDKQTTNTIKERLNLHVKRKILENSSTATATAIGNYTVTSQQYQQQQQLNQQKINNIITKSPNINSVGTNHINTTIGRDSTTIPKRKKRTKKNIIITSPAASTSRSVSRTGCGIGDDSHDDNLSCHDTNSNSTAITTNNAVLTPPTATNSKNSKDNKKEPDILAQILNQKKLALMRDPEIIELFNIMTRKLENNKNHNINQQTYQS